MPTPFLFSMAHFGKGSLINYLTLSQVWFRFRGYSNNQKSPKEVFRPRFSLLAGVERFLGGVIKFIWSRPLFLQTV